MAFKIIHWVWFWGYFCTVLSAVGAGLNQLTRRDENWQNRLPDKGPDWLADKINIRPDWFEWLSDIKLANSGAFKNHDIRQTWLADWQNQLPIQPEGNNTCKSIIDFGALSEAPVQLKSYSTENYFFPPNTIHHTYTYIHIYTYIPPNVLCI